jgi:hypothetical protein
MGIDGDLMTEVIFGVHDHCVQSTYQLPRLQSDGLENRVATAVEFFDVSANDQAVIFRIRCLIYGIIITCM